MTFTSLESGKGLAADTFSYLVSGISNWASWDFQTEELNQEEILDVFEAVITLFQERRNP